MKAIHSYLACTAGLVAGTFLALTASAAPAADANSDAFQDFDNYIKFSGQMPSVSGSTAAYQAHTQKAESGSGGIEDVRITKDLSKDTSVQIDGHALPGAEDYLAQFRVTKTDVGSVEVGYKTFRTFYDGAGGFFPLNNAYLPLYSRQLFVDRSKFFANATFALPHQPVFTFRYTSENRTGKKDSTIWGDTDQTGIPIYSNSALNPISADRKIVPAYLHLDEHHEQVELSVQHTVGNTTASVSVIGNRILNDDRRSVDRYPGELKPFPAIPSNPAIRVGPVQANNQNQGFDEQRLNEHALTLRAKVETALSDKVKVYVSGQRHKAGDDIGASRLISAAIQTNFGVQNTVGAFTTGGRPPYSYTSTGHIDQQIFTGVIGIETKLLPDLGVNLAVRAEQYDVSGYNNATYISYLVNQKTGAVTYVPLTVTNGVRTSEKPVTPEIQVRYTGIKTVALFADWDYRSSPGDERTSYIGIGTSGNFIIPTPVNSNDTVKEKHTNLKLGASWTPSAIFNARAEFFTKDHENSFNGYGVNLGEFYTLDYDIYGVRLTATVKPLPVLAFTTRFVEQRGKASIMSDGFAQGDSNDSRRYTIAETVDWNPNKSVYVQGNVNVVFDRTVTAYPTSTLSALNVLHNADNNYVNGSLITGLVVAKRTDLQLQGTYYKADNYNPALAGSTTPYGMSVREYSLTVGVKHKLTDRIVLNAKVGYLDSTNATSGGFSDYHGPLAYVAMDYKL